MSDPSGATSFSVTVAAGDGGARLDRVLAGALPHLSRARLQALIRDGHVWHGDTPVGDPARKVRAGETFRIEVPPPRAAVPEAQAIDLAVLYEDPHLIVIDKPAGLVVHPAAGNPDNTLVNALLAHCAGSLSGIGGVERPGIVHRLDKDTSGVMVAAKNDRAHRDLAGQFAAHTLERAYVAVVWGVPSPRSGDIEGAIGRSPHNRRKMAVVSRGGKAALTRYRVTKVLGNGIASVVECRLATGRTHQVRVHMAHIGHPLVADPVYGGRAGRRSGARVPEISLQRQALHAYLIGFVHPVSQEQMHFESELPNDINELISLLELFK